MTQAEYFDVYPPTVLPYKPHDHTGNSRYEYKMDFWIRVLRLMLVYFCGLDVLECYF